MALKKAGYKKINKVQRCKEDNLLLSVLLGQKRDLDVWQNTSLRDGHLGEKFVQLLVVPDGQLEMSGVDPLFLVVTGSVSSQFKDLSGQVFHDGGQVHWSTGSDAVSVVAVLHETVNAPHGELETSTARSALSLGTGLASLSTSRHFKEFLLSFARDL